MNSTNLKLGVSFGLVDNEVVLLHEIGLFLLLSLSCLVFLLDLFDQPECRVQVRAWRAQLAGLLHVRAPEGPDNEHLSRTIL